MHSSRRQFVVIAATGVVVVLVVALAIAFRDSEDGTTQQALERVTLTPGASSPSTPTVTAQATIPSTVPTVTPPSPPVSYGWLYQPFFVTMPETFLLRTEAEALEWAEVLLERHAASGTHVLSVTLMTRYDQLIAEVSQGSWAPSRDTDDTPVWRIAFGGAPLPFSRMRCGAPGSTAVCPESGTTVIWVRASDGSFDGHSFRADGYPALSDLATAAPAITEGLRIDPTLPLLAGAEVVHVVSVTTGRLRFVQSEVDPQTPLTTETWLNRTTGEAVVRTTRANGDLESLTIRHGLTVDRYLAESYDAATGTPRYTRLRTLALTPDDPAIRLPTAHLDWYREALLRGHAVVVASETYRGRPALKVQVGAGTDAQHIAYLDAEHLLPLAVLITNTALPGQFEVIAETEYLTIESFSAGDVPDSAFAVERPSSSETPRQIEHRRLLLTEAECVVEYPLWSAGEAFDGYDLLSIERDVEAGEDTAQRDLVTTTYQRVDDRGSRVVVRCYGRVMDHVRGEYIQQRGTLSEEIATATGPAWLWTTDGSGSVRIDLDRDGMLIVIHAPDRESGLAAVNALRPINASQGVIPSDGALATLNRAS